MLAKHLLPVSPEEWAAGSSAFLAASRRVTFMKKKDDLCEKGFMCKTAIPKRDLLQLMLRQKGTQAVLFFL